MDCQLRVGEYETVELVVDGRVWASCSTEWINFSFDLEFAFPYKLSRFAHVTYRFKTWTLHSPLSVTSVNIHEALLLKLLQDMERDLSSVDKNLAHVFGVMLANVDLVDTQDNTYTPWPVADLTYLQAEHTFLRPHIAVPPLKPPMSKEIVKLPEIPSHQWADRSMMETITARRSLYKYDDKPITIEQMSEFLARTLKVNGYLQGQNYDSTVRAYPSAGAAYELEAYLFIENCTSITTGFYHYDPGQHALERLTISDDTRTFWNKEASRSTGHQLEAVQILFFFTSRIGRIHWKIRPLALTYTNLGAVEQTLYLTATAMSLAPCALGSWPSKLFAQQTGIPLAEEALVGQFLLGSSQDVMKD
jgi:SagB-type dehydrogenase family enzyme